MKQLHKMKNTIETYIVDSFTNEPFKGNPTGVCLLNSNLTEDKMLSIAQELGFSETTFVQQTKKLNSYTIRYFSPVQEIPLCGHATLAASKVLFEKDKALVHIHFKNIQNLALHIHKFGNKIAMEFPVYDTISQDVPDAVLEALDIAKIINSAYNKETNILLLEIDSCEQLRNLSPDFEKLKRSHNSINGVLVTAQSTKENYDFESRYFWPWSGTNEDPVTGGTHTFLTKYWGVRLNKTKMNSFQCSQRTGFMEVELVRNKLIIKSEAQIILKGSLQI